ncbi:hypothetical protein AB4Z54_11760, partial [Streptomyces sp. MCAF7]
MSTESPWRLRDFRTLFTATALSQLGTSIGYLAVPLIAVTALDASPGQVGLLATLSDRGDRPRREPRPGRPPGDAE